MYCQIIDKTEKAVDITPRDISIDWTSTFSRKDLSLFAILRLGRLPDLPQEANAR